MIDDPLSKDHFRKQKYSLLVFLHFPPAAQLYFLCRSSRRNDIKAFGWSFFLFFPRIEYGLFEEPVDAGLIVKGSSGETITPLDDPPVYSFN